MDLKKLALSCVASIAIPAMGFGADAVYLGTPSGFEVMDISPNGKWAVGAYIDAYLNTYAFRWNLESDNIEIISTEPSIGWGISNDGTVVGEYTCYELTDNGASVQMAGYYKDGAWHYMELPSNGTIGYGQGNAITPDGVYAVGSIDVDGIYTPYIWKNGEIYCSLATGADAVAYCIAPDGQAAGGWSMQSNRTATYWTVDGDITLLEDSPILSHSPWNSIKHFSGDGTKAVYWGGWGDDDAEIPTLYCIYHMDTDEREYVTAYGKEVDQIFYGISDESMLVGYADSNGIVYKDGQYYIIDDYLTTRGANIWDYDGFWEGDDYGDYASVFRIVQVSPDENVFATRFYGKDGEVASLMILLDQDPNRPVTEFVGQQLPGLSTVELTWTPPVGTYNQGYYVYCNGKKISGLLPIQNKYYHHKNLDLGTYQYQIGTICSDNSEVLGDVITVTVTDADEPNAPYNLYGRQKGIRGATLTWAEPFNNLAHINYYDEDSDSFDSFCAYEAVEMEAAVCVPESQLTQYGDYTLQEVSFYPSGNHTDWKINCYTLDSNGTLTLIYTEDIAQELTLNVRNIVRLSEPVAVPSSGDLIVAIQMTTDGETQNVMMVQDNKLVKGYSDLLRQTSEDAFYSMYDSAMESYMLTYMSWVIDLGFGIAGTSSDDLSLSGYVIYMDGDVMAQVNDTSYSCSSVDEGDHTFGVQAVYSDGSSSALASVDVAITYSYPSIDEVTVTQNEDLTHVTFDWDEQIDDDSTAVTYTTAATASTGIQGLSSYGYVLMAASIYPASMLKSYGGYAIKTLRFYPLCDAIFTLMINEDGEQIYEYEVEDFEVGAWNEVAVDDLVLIKEGSEYQYIIDCFDPEPDVVVIAVDSGTAVTYYSDMVSIDNGDSWSSLSESGIYNNWMMGMVIADPDGRALEVDGYSLRIDNSVVNDELITETTYTYEMTPKDNYRYRLNVDTWYTGRDDRVRGTTNYFYLSTSGISDVEITDIVLRQGDNVLVAEGEGVNSISIYAIDGKLAANSQGNIVSISHLSMGVYIVRVETSTGAVTQKIRIK